MIIKSSRPTIYYTNNTAQQQKIVPVKIQCDYYSFDIAESDYDNLIAPSPTKQGFNQNLRF
jgi:hypothetical protein